MSSADEHRQRFDPRRCRRRPQPGRTDQGEDDHPHSSIRTRRRQRLPTIARGALRAPRICPGPKRWSDARIDPTEALHESAACANHRPPRRHRWGSCRLLVEVHGAPKQQQVAESSVGDKEEADATGHSKLSVLGIDGADEAIGASQPALCVGIYVQKLASGVFESRALSSASRRGRESGSQRYRRRTRSVGSRSWEPFA
jgi:hypothetical protein